MPGSKKAAFFAKRAIMSAGDRKSLLLTGFVFTYHAWTGKLVSITDPTTARLQPAQTELANEPMTRISVDARSGCKSLGAAAILVYLTFCGCNGQQNKVPPPRVTGGIANTSGEQQNWPNFRGPKYDSATGSSLPVQWAADQGIKWSARLPGRGASSPIRFGDRIYLTSYSGYGVDARNPGEIQDLRHHVICCSAITGTVQWEREIVGTALLQKMNPELARHGFASSTPATDGEMLFAWFGVTGLFAFDIDGNLRWQRNLGLETNYFGSSASPVLFGDLVIVNASIESNCIYALDKKTGAVVWTIDDVNECWSMPVIGNTQTGESELIVSSKNIVAGYDPKTGQQRWHCSGIQDYVVSVPLVVDGIVYLTGGKEKQMMAIRLGGKGDVETTHKIWETKMIGSNVSSPVYRDGRIFVFHDNGILQVVNAADGELLHRQRSATETQPFSSPLLVGEYLFMPFQDAGIAIYSADEECRQVAVNKFSDDSPLLSSITPGEGCFWIRSDRFLYCVDGTATGTVEHEWTKPGNPQTIVARSPYNLEVEKGWIRRYLLFMTSDQTQIAKYLLMPYQSVITDEQTELSNAIVVEEMPKYTTLLNRFRETQREHLGSPASREADFDARYQRLESDMDKLNNDVRILVKKLFSPEQMEKHTADAKAGKAHIKPE